MNKERPIIFSGEMIRSILRCDKSVTRRVIKPQPELVNYHTLIDPWWIWDSPKITLDSIHHSWPHCLLKHSPYEVGSTLWVRETWRELIDYDLGHNFVVYRADGEILPPHHADLSDANWRPSIFMPREFSRITLEVVSVRVEQLQSISEQDAKAEGVEPIVIETMPPIEQYKRPFVELWNEINGKKYPWDSNPWVFAITFRRLEQTP
jgi:hypothetical protein